MKLPVRTMKVGNKTSASGKQTAFVACSFFAEGQKKEQGKKSTVLNSGSRSVLLRQLTKPFLTGLLSRRTCEVAISTGMATWLG